MNHERPGDDLLLQHMTHGPKLLLHTERGERPAKHPIAMQQILPKRARGVGAAPMKLPNVRGDSRNMIVRSHPMLTLPAREICAASTDTEAPPEILTSALAATLAFWHSTLTSPLGQLTTTLSFARIVT